MCACARARVQKMLPFLLSGLAEVLCPEPAAFSSLEVLPCRGPPGKVLKRTVRRADSIRALLVCQPTLSVFSL